MPDLRAAACDCLQGAPSQRGTTGAGGWEDATLKCDTASLCCSVHEHRVQVQTGALWERRREEASKEKMMGDIIV